MLTATFGNDKDYNKNKFNIDKAAADIAKATQQNDKNKK